MIPFCGSKNLVVTAVHPPRPRLVIVKRPGGLR
jgi:hypothetical protein